MIFDTHAHYDSEKFDTDRDALLRGMPDAGIPVVVNVGAEFQGCKDSLALAEQYPNVYAALGIHPDSVGELTEEQFAWLKDQMQHPKVVAVGEIGLDYYWDNSPRDLQKTWFVRQIHLAKEVGLPIIVHSREAAADTMDIIKAERAWECGGVIHCYSYSVEHARDAKKLHEVVAMVPLERLVLETDSPYLAPAPFRGKRNDSTKLPLVVDAIAQIKGISTEEVEQVTFANACKLYPKVKWTERGI